MSRPATKAEALRILDQLQAAMPPEFDARSCCVAIACLMETVISDWLVAAAAADCRPQIEAEIEKILLTMRKAAGLPPAPPSTETAA